MNCFFFSSTVYAYILKWTQEARGNNIHIPKTFQQSNFTFSVLFENSCCQTKCFTLEQNYKMRFDLSASRNNEVQCSCSKKEGLLSWKVL